MIAQKIKLTKITTTNTCYVGLQLYSEGKKCVWVSYMVCKAERRGAASDPLSAA